jgi:hypothetical protein
MYLPHFLRIFVNLYYDRIYPAAFWIAEIVLHQMIGRAVIGEFEGSIRGVIWDVISTLAGHYRLSASGADISNIGILRSHPNESTDLCLRHLLCLCVLCKLRSFGGLSPRPRICTRRARMNPEKGSPAPQLRVSVSPWKQTLIFACIDGETRTSFFRIISFMAEI